MGLLRQLAGLVCRRHSARFAYVLALAATLAPVTLLFAPAASASTITPLPFTAFGSVAVDPVHGKVFVSGGRLDSRVAVLGTDGKLMTTLSSLPGASGLAFDPSYSTLYVGLSSGEIARINPATNAVAGRFSVSPYVPIGQMAYAGGRLWFRQSCQDRNAPIVRVNPDGSGLGTDGPNRYCATFATTLGHPEWLAVADLGLSPVDADLYRVDNGSFARVASTSNRPFSNLQSLAFNSSGTMLYAASGSPYEIQSFRTPDLAKTVSFPVGAYPAAVATGGDSYVAAGRSSTNTITVFASGNPFPLRTIDLPTGREIESGGLVFVGPTTLLAVTGPVFGSTGNLAVQVFGNVTTPPRPAKLTLTSSARSVTVGGRVTLSARAPSGATGSVRFYNGSTLLDERPLVKGRATLTVRIRQTSKFNATYAGDDIFASAKSASLTVAARYKISLNFVAGSKRKFKVGSQPQFVVKVQPAQAAIVTVDLQYRLGKRWLEIQRRPTPTAANGLAVLYMLKRSVAGQYRVRALIGAGSSRAQTPWHAFQLVR